MNTNKYQIDDEDFNLDPFNENDIIPAPSHRPLQDKNRADINKYV